MGWLSLSHPQYMCFRNIRPSSGDLVLILSREEDKARRVMIIRVGELKSCHENLADEYTV